MFKRHGMTSRIRSSPFFESLEDRTLFQISTATFLLPSLTIGVTITPTTAPVFISSVPAPTFTPIPIDLNNPFSAPLITLPSLSQTILLTAPPVPGLSNPPITTQTTIAPVLDFSTTSNSLTNNASGTSLVNTTAIASSLI